MIYKTSSYNFCDDKLWLHERNHRSNDTDGDGIEDGVEDFDHNGTITRETDPTLVDTDSDRIPDQLEDKNKNGDWESDIGETCGCDILTFLKEGASNRKLGFPYCSTTYHLKEVPEVVS